MTEQWRPIPGYGDRYDVSDRGRIRNRQRGRTLSPRCNKNGYPVVVLRRDGIPKMLYVHTLVLTAFSGPRPEGTVARHLDGDKTHNAPSNLAWGSPSENVYDRVRHGTHHYAKRTHCPQGHPFDEQNTRIRVGGARECRTCRRDYIRRWQAARAAS